MREKDVVGIFDLTGLLPSDQIIACNYYNALAKFVRKCSMLTVLKITQTAMYLKFHCQKVESTRNGKLRRLSGRFQTLIWRPGEMVQNPESPSLSGRVDSTDNFMAHSFVRLTFW